MVTVLLAGLGQVVEWLIPPTSLAQVLILATISFLISCIALVPTIRGNIFDTKPLLVTMCICNYAVFFGKMEYFYSMKISMYIFLVVDVLLNVTIIVLMMFGLFMKPRHVNTLKENSNEVVQIASKVTAPIVTALDPSIHHPEGAIEVPIENTKIDPLPQAGPMKRILSEDEFLNALSRAKKTGDVALLKELQEGETYGRLEEVNALLIFLEG